MKDYYTTLGVAATASAEEIKLAWRILCRQHHPDRDGGSAERMAEVNEAYRILSDEKLRAAYDSGQSTKPGQPAPLSKEAQAVQGLVGAMHTFAHIHHPVRKMEAIKAQAAKMVEAVTKELFKAEQARKDAQRALTTHKGLWETSSDQPNVFDIALEKEAEKAEKELEQLQASLEGLLVLQQLLTTYKLTKRGEGVCEAEERAESADSRIDTLFQSLEAAVGAGTFRSRRF